MLLKTNIKNYYYSFIENKKFKDYFSTRDKAEILRKTYKVHTSSSGSLVGDGLVLTAAHAIRDNDQPRIFYREKVLDADVVYRDLYSDIMLLKFDAGRLSGKLPHLEIADSVKIGQSAYSVGFPLGFHTNFEPFFYKVDVTSVKSQLRPNFFHLNGEFTVGCSGMAICNQLGQVIGVFSGKLEPADEDEVYPADWNLASSAEYFSRKLEKYLPASTSKIQRAYLTQERLASKLLSSAVVVFATGKTNN
jgi:S1-C subfamily serine protease